MRLALGIVWVFHGYDDVFNLTVSSAIENYGDAGIPLPALAAPFAAFTQLVGGVLFMLGTLTRLLAAGFTVIMLGAVFYVHLPEGGGFAGFEYPFALAAVAIAFILTGAGRFSVDQLVVDWWRRSRGSEQALEVPSRSTLSQPRR